MKSFVCSLCHNGILGGGLYLDSQSLTYKTNKLTVGKKYRNLVLPMQEIKEISWKWIVFPIATVNMKNGELYKFIIFNKSPYGYCPLAMFRQVFLLCKSRTAAMNKPCLLD
mgnify:CR=1 FL=1